MATFEEVEEVVPSLDGIPERLSGMGLTVVIGAGPAGLSAAYELNRKGWPVTVLEADPAQVGGLSRTAVYQGYRFDIGGHRFFSKSPEIEALWTEILGAEMQVCQRLSRILYQGVFFDYPIRPFDVFAKLGPIFTTLCLLSYLKARLFPRPKPVSFEDWVIDQFGERLYRTFFKTYTEKVWGIPCNQISADWAAQRIKGLSMASLIRKTLFPKGEGVIKTLIDRFRYPRLGPGQMWERIQTLLAEAGQPVQLDRKVIQIHWDKGGIHRVQARSQQGERFGVMGQHFISTMPLRSLVRSLVPAAPDRVREAAEQLRYRDFLTVVLVVDEPDLFPDNWIYIHDPSVRVGRIQNFKNWSGDMVPNPEVTCLGLEYFCSVVDPFWQLTQAELLTLAETELRQLGLLKKAHILDGTVIRAPKAYPVYDHGYQTHIQIIRAFLEEVLPNLQLAGRNGMHRYNNQDHAMMTGLLAARNILAGERRYDLWRVNQDAEYLEEGDPSAALAGGRAVPQVIGQSG
ncbi:MAG: NAD(P)/FAD-dependent oxidoreductase [Cyanobacteriota bacterium]